MRLEDRLHAFLRTHYYAELEKASHDEWGHVVVDFSLLDKFDPDIADRLLESPDEVLSALREAAGYIDVSGPFRPNIRIRNLPESRLMRIRNLRSRDLGKMVYVEGIVRSASEVKPQVYEAVYRCPDCGTLMTVPQIGSTALKAPKICENPECGRKGGFELVEQKLFDMRWLMVTEPFEVSEGEKPGEVNVFLTEDLTSPRFQRKTDPGNRLKIIGIFREIQRKIKGRKSVKMDTYIEAIYVEPSEVEFDEINITPEEEERIKELAKDPEIYSKLVRSIAPTIYGFETIKEALVLQMFGGTPHRLPDGSRIRGNIHILLTGDPGVGKSMLLKMISGMMPRGKYVSGKGVTGAGLTATVRKDDEIMGGWVLEAGALILANKGLIAIDEFDKMSRDDMIAMHEAMSVETISIAKASIIATLPAETAVLAGANPKFGRFDPMMSVLEQINLPETIMSRFDLKFVLRDKPEKERDEKLAEHVLKSRLSSKRDELVPEIDRDTIVKYIAYARKSIKEVFLSEEAARKIKEFYVDMRSMYADKSVAITLRQYEALIRLAEASAKVRLSSIATEEDADRAIRIMKYSLMQLGYDSETGTFDIDRMESGVTASKRNRIRQVIEIIESHFRDTGEAIPKSDLIAQAEDMGIKDVDAILESLLKEGVVFEPRPGFLKKL